MHPKIHHGSKLCQIDSFRLLAFGLCQVIKVYRKAILVHNSQASWKNRNRKILQSILSQEQVFAVLYFSPLPFWWLSLFFSCSQLLTNIFLFFSFSPPQCFCYLTVFAASCLVFTLFSLGILCLLPNHPNCGFLCVPHIRHPKQRVSI